MVDVVILCTFSCLVSDPKQRLAMFRKLEEMSKVRPIGIQPKHRPARLDYFKGKKLSIICAVNISSFCFCAAYLLLIVQYSDMTFQCIIVERISKK